MGIWGRCNRSRGCAVRIKQKEVHSWICWAIAEQTRLLGMYDDSDVLNGIQGRIRALEAVKTAMHGNIEGLQALAGAGVQSGLKGV